MSTSKSKPSNKSPNNKKPPAQRLNSNAREALSQHAQKMIFGDRRTKYPITRDSGVSYIVQPYTVGAPSEGLYNKLLDAIRDLLDLKYPMRDMRVLARYNKVETPNDLNVRFNADYLDRPVPFPDGMFNAWGSFRKEHRRSLDKPSWMEGRWSVPNVTATPGDDRKGAPWRMVSDDNLRLNADEVEAFRAVYKAWAEAYIGEWQVLQNKMVDYRTLILLSATWEDVEAVWPEARTVHSKFLPTEGVGALVRYDPALVERIKHDVAERQESERAEAAAEREAARAGGEPVEVENAPVDEDGPHVAPRAVGKAKAKLQCAPDGTPLTVGAS